MKKIIIMIDDDEYFLSKWKEALGTDITFISYSSISDFEEDLLEGNTEKINNSECIIVDYEFGYTNVGKKDFASYIRNEHGYNKPIILSSLHDSFGEYDQLVRETFDIIIDKTPLTYDELSNLIKSNMKGKLK